ncbi:PREDICTED: zinc finger protein 395 [Lepidothrix coronata]|uniref:Zinc finger protein 395 n=1 Tax=Lepidothrix coronata TaxID=321398 RepID=A0A6J0IIZ2_9PASS|nr:PREDICTED: zinc finger protein 395 [Lepidothrix coronata]
MATALSRRLGKRSLLGTRVPADGMQIPGLQPEPGRAPAAPEDGSCALSVEENGRAPGFSGLRQLHSGQQVLVTSNGQECEQGKVLLPEQGSQGCWRVQDTLQPPAGILQRSVSSSIDVPKRSVPSPGGIARAGEGAPVFRRRGAAMPRMSSRASCDPWKESGDVSDSGSSTTSGHWSGASDISTPSPPHPAGSPKYSGEALSSPRADDGFETDSDPFLPEEPAPRKRKSAAVMLWSLGLQLGRGRSIPKKAGTRRHLFTTTPFFFCSRDGADSEQRKREEDFYYTEVQVKEDPTPEVATTTTTTATTPSPMATSAPIIIQQALARPEPLLLEQPGLEPALAGAALSQSAPGSFWHIQADHAYQVSRDRLPGPSGSPPGISGRAEGRGEVGSANPAAGGTRCRPRSGFPAALGQPASLKPGF